MSADKSEEIRHRMSRRSLFTGEVDRCAVGLLIALKGSCDEMARAGLTRSEIEGRLSAYIGKLWDVAGEVILKDLPKRDTSSISHRQE